MNVWAMFSPLAWFFVRAGRVLFKLAPPPLGVLKSPTEGAR